MKERFLLKVDKESGLIHPVLKSRCWLWTGGIRGSNNYGNFWANGRPNNAHRISYLLFVGPISPSQMVLHRCDNPLCVRPSHLFLGTHLDNMKDRNDKGRQAKGDSHWTRTRPENLVRGDAHRLRKNPELAQGENNGRAKLTEDDVRLIRKRSNETVSSLAREFGVSRMVISWVIRRISWKHVV